jgi:hypothetical protein
MKKSELKTLIKHIIKEKKSWYYKPSPSTIRIAKSEIAKFKRKYPKADVKIDNKEGFIRVNGKIAVDISSMIGKNHENIFKQLEDTLKKNEDLSGAVSLSLPDGTINGDPKGKEKTEPTLNMYKKKAKNISEAATSFANVNYSGINFLVTVQIKTSQGEVSWLPKSSKDIDALNEYGKDRAKKFLKLKTQQSLGFPVWDDSYSEESRFRFKFSINEVEELLIKKIK